MNHNVIRDLGLQGVRGEFEGATEAQIVEAEAKLRLRLPDDYRNFLREIGASLFTEDVVFTPLEPSAWAAAGNQTFDLFYGVSADPGFDLGRVNARLEGDIPERTIAIGHDSGSNLILLSVDTSQLLFFDRETGKTSLIAKSFEDFLNAFHHRN